MDINNLVTTSHYIIPNPKEQIIFDKKVRGFCVCPYPRHPKGCKNYNKNPLCPPKSSYRAEILDHFDKFILVISRFDIMKYVEEFKKIHPDYSSTKLRNLLWWQSSLFKITSEYIKNEKLQYDDILSAGSGMMNAQSMESAGIHVYKTLDNLCIEYDKTFQNFTLCIVLLMEKNKVDLFTYIKKGN